MNTRRTKGSPAERPEQKQQALDPVGQVQPPTVEGLPDGYFYRVTRYADVVRERAFAESVL